jgi:hypothetical protein
MRKMNIGIAFAAALALCGGYALAVDQLVIGKKLLIKNPPAGPTKNKVVYLSKDPSIAAPAVVGEDPRCIPQGGSGAGGALVVKSPTTNEGFNIALPCLGWTVNAAGNLFKYKDTTGASCNVVLVKNAKLVKAVCKGPQVSYDLGANQVDVDVKVRVGTAPRQYCSSFNAGICDVKKDGSDDKTYLAKNCTAGAVACTASPSGAFIEVASLF